MSDPPPLTTWQERKLDMLARGYALDAGPRQFNKTERRQMDDLVRRGLIRLSGGAYVKLEEPQPPTP